jgi:hypothetical protein
MNRFNRFTPPGKVAQGSGGEYRVRFDRQHLKVCK